MSKARLHFSQEVSKKRRQQIAFNFRISKQDNFKEMHKKRASTSQQPLPANKRLDKRWMVAIQSMDPEIFENDADKNSRFKLKQRRVLIG